MKIRACYSYGTVILRYGDFESYQIFCNPEDALCYRLQGAKLYGRKNRLPSPTFCHHRCHPVVTIREPNTLPAGVLHWLDTRVGQSAPVALQAGGK
jgi:hypothetical protein